MHNFSFVCILLFSFLFTACSGVKVINPNDKNENAGVKMLDVSQGKIQFVDTYSCKIVASNGKRVTGFGKSEHEAREEALSNCRSKTLISFCLDKNLKCVKN